MNVEAIFYLKKQMKLEKNFIKKAVYNVSKDKEQNGSLANEEKKVLKRINSYIKKFKNGLDKLQKYQYNITHGIDYLFNEEDDYYKSRHNGDFYCLNCFHSYTTENKLRKHKRICEDHDFFFK